MTKKNDAPDWYKYDGQTKPEEYSAFQRFVKPNSRYTPKKEWRVCKFGKACMPHGNPSSDCDLWVEGKCLD